MNAYLVFVLGILVGWITKIPFLYKWYREFEEEKRANTAWRRRLKEQKDYE